MPIHVSHKMHYGACKECLAKIPSVRLAAECEGRAMVVCVLCNGFRQHAHFTCGGLLGSIHDTHELDGTDNDESRPYCTECGARLGVELRARCTAVIRVHESHRMDGSEIYSSCVRCGESLKDQNLLEECPGVKSIHKTHWMTKDGICERCKCFHKDDLFSVCEKSSGVETWIHSSHDIGLHKDGTAFCANCDLVNSASKLVEPCSGQNNSVSITVSPEKVNFQLDQNFVWVVYGYESDAYVANAISIHVTPEEAIEKLSELGGSKRIGKWPFGMELHEAVKKWETRNE